MNQFKSKEQLESVFKQFLRKMVPVFSVVLILSILLTHYLYSLIAEYSYSFPIWLSKLGNIPAVLPLPIITIALGLYINSQLSSYGLICSGRGKSLVSGGKWKKSNTCPSCGMKIWNET